LRNALFLAIFLGVLAFPSAPLAHAQSFSSEQQVSLDSLKQQLIDLLLLQISMLQDQIADILAKQAVTETSVKTVESKVDQLSQPSFGSVSESSADILAREKVVARKTLSFNTSLTQADDMAYFVARGYFEGEQIDTTVALNGTTVTPSEHCSDFTGLSIRDCILRFEAEVNPGDKLDSVVTYEGQTYSKSLIIR
jgi:hypothetical protein